jgi:hypothetical protein
MRVEEVKISPTMAREWLAVSPERNQRPINQRNLAKILHAIENGDWKFTHQAIALDPTGFVLDGRHRLTAIASQRRHITSWVAFDADPETFGVIDVGKARSPGESLHIAGYRDTNVLSAVTRQVLAYPLIVGTNSTLGSATNSMTTADVLIALANPEIGKPVQDSVAPGHQIAKGIGRYGTKTSASVLLAVISIYSEFGPDAQEEFATRLADGVDLGAGSPIRAFRQWIITESGYAKVPGTYKQTTFLANGIRAWNDYAHGRERQTVRHRGGADNMPEVA